MGEAGRRYIQAPRPAFGNETGYHVYVVPAGFEVEDGQDQTAIGISLSIG